MDWLQLGHDMLMVSFGALALLLNQKIEKYLTTSKCKNENCTFSVTTPNRELREQIVEDHLKYCSCA